MAAKKPTEEYTDEEVERRARDMIRRSFTLPHKTAEDFKGKTPRARAMAHKRKATGPETP